MRLPNGSWFSKRRRDLLAALGLSAGGLLSAGSARGEAGGSYSLVQGERCIPLTPLSGDQPVEAFYGYQLPEGEYAGENGARDDGGPYYGSTGTRDLQVDDASLLFLYDGPEGLSLVVVHGSLGASNEGGGSATFAFAGLPGDGEWVVRDDFYLDPETGEPAGSNYDRWNVGGTDATVHWTWGEEGTDGGAFRGLDGEFVVEIDPAFNDAAARLEKNYEGRVTEWQVLSGDPANPDRHSLALDRSVTIRRGACEGDGGGTAQQRETTQQRTETKHERKQRKHEEKRERKHERKQKKHERKRTKHERKQQKHERKQQKHERKQRKHNKHEKD